MKLGIPSAAANAKKQEQNRLEKSRSDKKMNAQARVGRNGLPPTPHKKVRDVRTINNN